MFRTHVHVETRNRSSRPQNLKRAEREREKVVNDDRLVDGTFSQRDRVALGRDVVCSESRHVGRVSSD